jgi:hypothetical protein
VTALAAIGFIVAADAVWPAALLVAGATAAGTFLLLAELDPRGVPIEALATPVVAAAALTCLTAFVGVGAWSLPVLGGGAILTGLALSIERRLLGPADESHARARQQLMPFAVLLAFVGFVAVAASVPGGLVEPASGTQGSAGLDEPGLLVLAVADGLIAFLLGYRLAALQAPSVREATWAAGTFAVIIGAGAASLRALALPRLVGPAILAAIFYLWTAYRQASGAERRSAAWLWEYLALAGAAALAVAWNLLLRR